MLASSRTSDLLAIWSQTTVISRSGVLKDVLGIEDTFWSHGLSLEASSPRKFFCSRPRTALLWFLKIWLENARNLVEILWKPFFYLETPEKNFWRPFRFFFWRTLDPSVFFPWLWPRAFLSLSSRESLSSKVGPWPRIFCVLGLGFSHEPCVLGSTVK